MAGFLIYLPIVVIAAAVGIATRQKDKSILAAERAHFEKSEAQSSLDRVMIELDFAETPDAELISQIGLHIATIYQHCDSTGDAVETVSTRATVCSETGELIIEGK